VAKISSIAIITEHKLTADNGRPAYAGSHNEMAKVRAVKGAHHVLGPRRRATVVDGCDIPYRRVSGGKEAMPVDVAIIFKMAGVQYNTLSRHCACRADPDEGDLRMVPQYETK